MGFNNANTNRSDKKNTVVMDSIIENERMGESNEDSKVGLKVQLNIATTILVSHQPTTAMGMLVLVSLIPVSICRQLALIYCSRLPLSRV